MVNIWQAWSKLLLWWLLTGGFLGKGFPCDLYIRLLSGHFYRLSSNRSEAATSPLHSPGHHVFSAYGGHRHNGVAMSDRHSNKANMMLASGGRSRTHDAQLCAELLNPTPFADPDILKVPERTLSFTVEKSKED